jgi:hypothetical protein
MRGGDRSEVDGSLARAIVCEIYLSTDGTDDEFEKLVNIMMGFGDDERLNIDDNAFDNSDVVPKTYDALCYVQRRRNEGMLLAFSAFVHDITSFCCFRETCKRVVGVGKEGLKMAARMLGSTS